MPLSRAPFISKTFQLVSDEKTNDVVSWNATGDALVIWDSYAFEVQILPTYFKHNKLSSFIRQLNTYGFKKDCTSPQQFSHPHFARHSTELAKICRTPRHQITTESKPGNVDNRPCSTEELVQILKTLSQRQHECDLLLASVYEELAATRRIIQNFRMDCQPEEISCGKRPYFDCNPTPAQVPEKRYKPTVPPTAIPQSFEELFGGDNWTYWIALELPPHCIIVVFQ